MRFRTLLVVAVLLLPALVFAGNKKKKAVSAVFGNAKYVYVLAEDGDIYQPSLLPEDRQAIENVNDALQDWGRYTLTASQSEAELVFIVRKGRLGAAKLGATVGGPSVGPYPGGAPRQAGTPGGPQTGPAAPIGTGTMAGGDVGPPDDFLEVRMRDRDGNLSSPIWEHSRADGLDAPRVLLLQTLKDAVERDYPQK